MKWVWMRNAALGLAVLAMSAGGVSGFDSDVRVLRDMDYIVGVAYANHQDKLDLYLPEGVEGFPLVVFFHGGGLRQGDKRESEHVGRALAASGYGAAIVNYRLSPEVSFPEHVKDAAASVAWVYRHIQRFGGNPEKTFVCGHSAGAYLAALLALDGRYLEEQGLSPAHLAGAMPISGFFYVDRVAPDRPKDVWGKDKKVWLEASPSQYVSADVPPMLFVYGDGDAAWRKQQNEDIRKALEDKGHPDVATVEIPERDHLAIWQRISPGDPTLDALLAFMRKH